MKFYFKAPLALLLILVFGSLGLYLWDVKQDRSRTVRVSKSTVIYNGIGEYGSYDVAGTAEPGDNLKVLRVRYEKDAMYVYVERNDSAIGWILVEPGVELSSEK